MKYQCKIPSCNFETDNRHSIAGHMAGHSKRGEKVPEPKLPTPEEVAVALLNRVTKILEKYEWAMGEASKVIQLEKIVKEQEKELEMAKQEKDRILKIHNIQVKAKKLTDSETLIYLARLS